MNCPNCHSQKIRKNGHRRGKQNYQCKECGRQFITQHSQVGYLYLYDQSGGRKYLTQALFSSLEAQNIMPLQI
jgi:transposase-like protein